MRRDTFQRCDVCGDTFPADARDGAPFHCPECLAERFERDAAASGALADVADALRAVAPSVPARWTGHGKKGGQCRNVRT
jgi:hypothetical protein